jgi:hypothetical protein
MDSKTTTDTNVYKNIVKRLHSIGEAIKVHPVEIDPEYVEPHTWTIRKKCEELMEFSTGKLDSLESPPVMDTLRWWLRGMTRDRDRYTDSGMAMEALRIAQMITGICKWQNIDEFELLYSSQTEPMVEQEKKEKHGEKTGTQPEAKETPRDLVEATNLVSEILDREIGEGEKSQCVICMDKSRCVVLFPCKHLCTCEICSANITDCPLCRAKIQSKEKIYFP